MIQLLEFMSRGWWEFFVSLVVLGGIWVLIYDSISHICNAIKRK